MESAALDSQDPKHIEQALELIDAMETVITEWKLTTHCMRWPVLLRVLGSATAHWITFASA